MIPLQLDHVVGVLRGLLDSPYAFVILFGIFVLEGAMLMYFMPSEAIVPGAIYLMGNQHHLLSGANAAIIVVAVAGATVGQYALFKVAQRGGREYLLQKSWFRVGESRLDRFDRWFDRWGPVVVPVSNSLLFTRGMLTVPAGFSDLDDRQFAILSAVGTLSFECLLAAAWIFFGKLF